MRPTYVQAMGATLPNAPVPNDAIEEVLGLVAGVPSRIKRRILEQNGIESRHYAIDRETGRRTHTNATLSAEAVRRALERAGLPLDRVDLLACGTSTPDLFVPSHGLMVQGALEAPPCEVVTTAGVCASGMAALRFAHLAVAGGERERAVVCASEMPSPILRASHVGNPTPREDDAVDRDPRIAFDQDFLRFMLSDAAAAAVLAPEPGGDGPTLRLEWVDAVAYAGEAEACMIWGGRKRADGGVDGWLDVDDLHEALERRMLNASQDVKLLAREVGPQLVGRALPTIRARRDLSPRDVDWFLPHYSSRHFRQELHDRLRDADFPIDFDRWFTNLPLKGNTGAASIFVMLEELLESGRLRAGERVLCFVPESARFTSAWALFTVVAGG